MFNKLSVSTIRIFIAAIMLFFLLGGLGYAGSSIEYIHLDPNLIDKKIHFKKPMVYQIFINRDIAQKYGFLYPKYEKQEVIRELVDTCTAKESVSYYKELLTENIEEGMTFIIKGSYWVRHDLIKREFAPEYQVIILQDKNKIISTYMIDGDAVIDSLKSNTDFGDY